MRIGFIGTGTMGTPIASCLIAAGHRLTVYDLRPEAMGVLIGHGAATADSPSEAAYGAETVFTSLRGRAKSRRRRSIPTVAFLPGCAEAAPIST
jgi:3-hydroxyisobutyrate dehydrogenase-like beta-hydroxyacid dehydrogenase